MVGGGGGRPLLPEILGQPAPLERDVSQLQSTGVTARLSLLDYHA